MLYVGLLVVWLYLYMNFLVVLYFVFVGIFMGVYDIGFFKLFLLVYVVINIYVWLKFVSYIFC